MTCSIDQVTFVDYLKDERRPLQKVEEFNTRLFSAAPLDFLLFSRILFLPFLKKVVENCDHSGIVIGLNPHSEAADTFVRQTLKPDSDVYKYFDGDYSYYDGTIPLWITCEISEIVASLFPKEKRHIINYFFSLLMSPKHIFGRREYTKVGGNPSGNPITSLFNSLHNQYLCYYFAAKRNLSVEEIRTGVFPVVMGDDNIICVVKHIDLSALHFAEYAKTLGMTYTNASKGTNILPYTPFDKLTFLKRTFVNIDNSWRMLLDTSVLYESILWVRRQKGVSPFDAFLEVANSQYHEASLYGIEFTSYFYDLLDLLCRSSGETLNLPLPKDFIYSRSKDTGYNLENGPQLSALILAKLKDD